MESTNNLPPLVKNRGSTKLTNICTLEGHSDRVWHVSWSPTGNTFATCSGDKTIKIWGKSKDKWECKTTLRDSHQRTVRRTAWSPDSKHLAAASFDSTTTVWERQADGGFECIATLEGHENEVKAVAWDASGALLATCSRDKSVWIWEMEADNEFECISVLHGHSQDVKSVLWHPVKEALFSCSYDDTIKVWEDDEDDWYCSHTLAGHSSTVWDVAFDQTGDRMASCSDDTTVIIWDTKVIKDTPKNVCVLTGYHKRTVFSVSWSLEGLLATGAADDTIRVFKQDSEVSDRPSFFLAASVEKAHSADVNCVAWSTTEPRLLASAGDDGLVKLWSYEE